MASEPAPNRQRVERFEWNRHYFHNRSPLARRRTQWCVLAFVLAGGWLALGWTLPEGERQHRLTHGPLASPHAAWEQNCDACHTPSAFDQRPAKLFANVHTRWHNFRCETCHQGAKESPKDYAPHHGMTSSCSQCHHDHQGRDVSLVKMVNSNCIECHQDIRLKSSYDLKIERFAGNGKGAYS